MVKSPYAGVAMVVALWSTIFVCLVHRSPFVVEIRIAASDHDRARNNEI